MIPFSHPCAPERNAVVASRTRHPTTPAVPRPPDELLDILEGGNREIAEALKSLRRSL